ncbi:histone acetyltransferase HAC1-like isoform X3 [Impatiens glandulifera]|uniref:histone acetyltransferase HAC1-like isoform X3 n=1 Tax=Impatiens glandulifera TaxID=253017 RepID=UPI001FB0A278|nr:histone acetyltransferase HAC1-like isoform X3 [Impatiens glandulifera]
MDRNTYEHGISFNRIENQVTHIASQTSQLHQSGLNYCPTGEGKSQTDQNKNSRANNVNSLSENNRSENHIQQSEVIWGVCMPPCQQVLEHVNVSSNEGADPQVQPSMIKHDPLDVVPSSQQCYMPLLGKSSSFFPPATVPTSFSGQCGAYRTNGPVLFKNGSLCSSKVPPLSTDCYQGVARIPLDSVKSSRFSLEGMRHVSAAASPSPDQSSSVTSCFEIDTVAFDSRPTFPDELRLKRYGGLSKDNQNLYNKKFPSVPVESHVLPPSTCPNFYPEQRKSSDIAPNAYLDNLVPFSNEGVLSCNVVVPGFKRQQEAFVQLDKSPTAEYQQLNKKHKYIFEQQPSVLHDTLSNGVHYAPSESSALISQPTLVSRPVTNVMLSKVLMCYIKHKLEHPGHSQASFLTYLHSAICRQGKCNCDLYLKATSHFDICRSWDCVLCSSARKSRVKGRSTWGSRKLESNKLSHTIARDTEDFPPSKHVKMGNICHVDPSENESHDDVHVMNIQKGAEKPVTEKLQEVHLIVERSICVRPPVASSAVMINNTTGIIETLNPHVVATSAHDTEDFPPSKRVKMGNICHVGPSENESHDDVHVMNMQKGAEKPVTEKLQEVHLIVERSTCVRPPVASSAVMINNMTGIIETLNPHVVCTHPEVLSDCSKVVEKVGEPCKAVTHDVTDNSLIVRSGIVTDKILDMTHKRWEAVSASIHDTENVGSDNLSASIHQTENVGSDNLSASIHNTENVGSDNLSASIHQTENVDSDNLSSSIHNTENVGSDNLSVTNPVSISSLAEASFVSLREEEKQVTVMPTLTEHAANCDLVAPESAQELKSMESKTLGVSLIDFFTAKQIKEHLSSLAQNVGQKVRKDMDQSTMSPAVAANLCQMCSWNRFVFASAPMYCSSCCARIKPNSVYYWGTDETETRHWFCTGCFKGSHGDNITFHGISISKAKLTKTKNTQEDEEFIPPLQWVQCDKCEGWQHQICALYNDKRDCGGNASYICPGCLLRRMEMGEHVPLPKTAACGAKDLPITKLSDHIEHRLFKRLKQEREDRARAQHKNVDEVPGAEDLAVRVVLSVNKLLKVNQQFLDIFNGKDYPTEFPYKSKVILLFQKIEGVDVCLFGMYVQEFGSECGLPNNRCVYISYLDSVKYFRPDIKTVAGEALRTLVYHEILIGYMEYCKKRGFVTGYIWACPPVKGEDYILYCHPGAQKTPRSDKLRNWYKSMLRKATEENIVVQCTNLYDHFFVLKREQNVKITVARLPCFDGDYWSGYAVEMMKNFDKGNGGSSSNTIKKAPTKRIFKSMGHTNPSDDSTKDILIMQKLGQTILPVKEDFIVVSLQFPCTNCNGAILHGRRWSCSQCKSFHICGKCHDDIPHLTEGGTHTTTSGEKHVISEVDVDDLPVDTEDSDVTIENSYFENRHSFLSFCQVNHYQFDTLRRAKHSSMMILYNLHCLTTTTNNCSICNIGITAAANGWHCDTCPKFNVCDSCYQQKGDSCHVHKLSGRTSSSDDCLKVKQLVQKKQKSVEKEALDLMFHISKCTPNNEGRNGSTCSYPNCLKVRELFRHATRCSQRASGGCNHCKKVGSMLKLHSMKCVDMDCIIPHCLSIRNHKKMMILQSEKRRRAAVVP